MSRYDELLAQRAAIEEELAQLHESARTEALGTIKSLVEKFSASLMLRCLAVLCVLPALWCNTPKYCAPCIATQRQAILGQAVAVSRDG